MKSIVFGGTGFIGSHVVEQLALAGHDVTVAIRKNSNTSFLESLDVEIMEVDFAAPDSISAAIKENSIVYNCIADPKLHQPIKKYREIEVELTRQLAEIAAKKKVQRFVQLSTVVVYGFDRPPKPIDERFPCKPVYNFDRVMLEREQAVKDVAANTGLDVVILRPAATIGNRDKASFFAMFYDAHKKGQYPIIGDGRARFSCIDTRDIGRAMVWLGELQEAKGQTYLAKGYETSWLDLKSVFDDNLGKTAKIQKLPKSIAMFIGTLMEWLTPYSRQPVMTRFAVRSLTTDTLFDDGKLRETGFRPKYSFEESVQNAIVDLQSRYSTNISS